MGKHAGAGPGSQLGMTGWRTMPWRAGGAGAVQPPQRRSQVKQRSRLARAVFQDSRDVGGLPCQGPPPDENQIEMGSHLAREEGASAEVELHKETLLIG